MWIQNPCLANVTDINNEGTFVTRLQNKEEKGGWLVFKQTNKQANRRHGPGSLAQYILGLHSKSAGISKTYEI